MDPLLILSLLGLIIAAMYLANRIPRDKTTPSGDPLSEAEVYLAFGRRREAEAVLVEGLERDPGRTDISEMLLRTRKAK